MARDFAAGLWRLADPKISLASFASLFLGASAAAASGPLAWGWLALTVLGIFCLEVAKNASGELVDYDSGTDLAVAEADRSPFSGGKRVLVDGLLSRSETAGIAAVSYALGIVAGLVIVAQREPRILWLGVIGTALAYGYHAAPARLSYRGLGELAVATCYGPLIAGGTWLVLRAGERGPLDVARLLPSLPLGLLIGAFLWVNEFPDFLADRQAGKLNLVVRLGRERAARGFVVLLTVAFGATLLLPLAGTPPLALLGLLAALPAASAARTLLAHPTTTAAIIPAQAKTLLAFLLYAVASGIGVWLG